MNMKKIVIPIARKYSLNPILVLAIIKQESNGDRFAIRYERDFKFRDKTYLFARLANISPDTEDFLQSCSIGLMQVMGVVARELGHKKNLLELTDPEIGIEYGCKKLAQLSLKYQTLAQIIAAYNSGSPRIKNGKFINQKYVDSVMGYMRKYE